MIDVFRNREGLVVVQSRANANDDWRSIGTLVQSPFLAKNSTRYEFQPSGEWIGSYDLIALGERIKKLADDGKLYDLYVEK